MATLNVSAPVQKELDNIYKLFHVSDDQLKKITDGFGQAFRRGLQAPDQPVVMGPSFVTHAADGTEKGSYLVLDVSWSTLLVSKIDLDGRRSFTQASKIFEISKDMVHADAVVFFDFLANCVSAFLKENSIKGDGLLLGFIFPFALQKSNLAHGKLLAWSKGYSVENVIGQDVAQLLQDALDRARVGVKCDAVVNDAVAALLSESYLSAPCVLSAIFGAGTNGSYMESGASITKLPQFQGTQMMINTEWGAFSERALLSRNTYDDTIDEGSSNPGTYLFQKMISWFYLGDIARLVLLSLVEHSPPLLFGGVATENLKKPLGFPTFDLFQIEDAKDLGRVKEIIAEVLSYNKDTISNQDAEITRWVCTLVATRGARLAGCPVAAVITQVGRAKLGQGPIPIATHGELFIGSEKFASRLKQSVGTILGKEVEKRLEFHDVKNGGIVGGALAVFDEEHDH